MKCLEILIKTARKMRKKAENSGICAKFHSFISFFQSYLEQGLGALHGEVLHGRAGAPMAELVPSRDDGGLDLNRAAADSLFF